MDNSTSITLSRMVAQQRAMDVTANNIANADTPGFRASRMLFSDWLVREPASGVPRGGQTISFAQDRATWQLREPGSVAMTGNPLDLAIGNPDAWFAVQTAAGARLTRAGHFSRDAAGRVVDEVGHALLDPLGRPISLPPTDTRITVAGDGSIATESGPAGTIGLVVPANPRKVVAEGDRLYAPGGATLPVTAPRITQGGLEGSNVQPIAELTRMTDQVREFQFTAQFVQAEADRQQSAIDKILKRS